MTFRSSRLVWFGAVALLVIVTAFWGDQWFPKEKALVLISLIVVCAVSVVYLLFRDRAAAVTSSSLDQVGRAIQAEKDAKSK